MKTEPIRKSQADLILARLRRSRGKRVAMPSLAACSGSLNVHSRINQLRNRGCEILNVIERDGRHMKSYYVLS